MKNLSEKRQVRRGRILKENTIPPEELAKRKAERTQLGLRCRAIFERLRPQLIDEYYNYFIAIEPDSEDYLIAPQLPSLIEKIREIYGEQDIKMTAFRLNERGTCGMI
jgi:hypothetical protein